VRSRTGDFSFTLKALDLATGGVALPVVLTDEGDDPFVERMHLLKQFLTALDDLFARFLVDRLGPPWSNAWEPALGAWAQDEPVGAATLKALHGAAGSRG
jgi:hypothetical protein